MDNFLATGFAYDGRRSLRGRSPAGRRLSSSLPKLPPMWSRAKRCSTAPWGLAASANRRSKLRRGRKPSEGLAFIARDSDGRVVGTVRLWDVTAGSAPALLLGPLAVDPSLGNAGIGSALMRHAIAEAGRLGHRAILLVGDAPYYSRFGFSADSTGALAMPGPYERHRLLALELVEGALDAAYGLLRPAGRLSRPVSRGVHGTLRRQKMIVS